MTTIHIPIEVRDLLADLGAARRAGVGALAEQLLREALAQPEHARLIEAVRALRAEAEKGAA